MDIMTAKNATKKQPSPAARNERLEARIPSNLKTLFQRAAELQGRTLTDFVIASVHAAAMRAIEEHQAIQLSADESRAFAEALLSPRAPSPRLKAAARRYVETLGG
jgi:uncharacterized protein (DUF1778 family)